LTEIYLHIGMQRTGTTFLQQEIFPKINVNLVNFEKAKLRYIILNKSIFSEEIKSRIKTGQKNLISNENIYCDMWSNEDDRFKILDKIKLFYPNGKIIFGVRNKNELLISWYKKYVVNGGTCSFKEFKQKPFIKKLDYEPYINRLLELFGEKNIYIYKYEDMKQDIHCFVEKLCNFIGVKPPEFKNIQHNVGYSLWQLKVSLILNRFFRTKLNPNGLIPAGRHGNWLIYRILFQSPYFPKFIRGRDISWEDLINDR